MPPVRAVLMFSVLIINQLKMIISDPTKLRYQLPRMLRMYVDYVPYRMCGKCKECGKCPMIYAEKLYKMQKCHFPGRMDVKLTFLQGMLLLMVYAPAPCGLGCVVRSHR